MSDFVTRLDWEAASHLLHAAQRIIIVTHISPDGDAIGSLVGLGLALQQHGKSVTLAVDDGVPPRFRFMPATENVLGQLDNPQADLVISADASSFDRLGKCGVSAFALGTPTIVIDHHPTNTFFGTAHIVHSGFVSTSEAILEWFDVLGWDFSEDIANALMVGLITDTQAFRVGNVSDETFRKAAHLMNKGVDLRGIIERTLTRMTTGQLPIIGRAFAKSQLDAHVIWTGLKLLDYEETGMSVKQSLDIATDLLRDEDAFIAAYFHETEEGSIRVSMHCVPGFNVGDIAFSLCGGGHYLAAGCTLPNISLEDAFAKLLPLLKAEAARGKPLYG